MTSVKKWFLLQLGQVQGPYTVEETQELIEKAENQKELLVWGRGLAEWLSPFEWKLSLTQGGSAVSEVVAIEQPVWRYRDPVQEFGPYTYTELIEQLKKRTDFGGVYLIGEGFDEWRDIFSVQKVISELGITRRTHARVPIMGILRFTSKEAPALRVVSISEGGLGVTEVIDLKISEKFNGVLSSPHLFQEVDCTCEVVYLGAEGYAGLRFISMTSEAQAAVIEYVNKFKDMGEL